MYSTTPAPITDRLSVPERMSVCQRVSYLTRRELHAATLRAKKAADSGYTQMERASAKFALAALEAESRRRTLAA